MVHPPLGWKSWALPRATLRSGCKTFPAAVPQTTRFFLRITSWFCTGFSGFRNYRQSSQLSFGIIKSPPVMRNAFGGTSPELVALMGRISSKPI
jgi:hypothetical protein